MTALLPRDKKRSRYLFDWSAQWCLEQSGSLNAITGQAATFSRAGLKTALDANGALRAVPHSLPAFQWATDPVSGLSVPALLIEPAHTLNLTAPSDFSNVAWTKTTATVATGVADPLGGTGACTLTATGATAQVFQVMATGSNIVRTNSVWLRRRTGSGAIGLLDPKNTVYSTVTLTTAWQRFTNTGATSINRAFGIQISTNGDAVDAYVAQQDDSSFASSTAPVARVADSLTHACNIAPAAMTVYAKFIEQGTLSAVGGFGGVLLIGDLTGVTGNQFYVSEDGAGHYRVVGRTVTSTATAAPTIGQTVELRAALNADGSVFLGQSINGAAEVVAATSAALALPSAWSGASIAIGALGTSINKGSAAHQKVRIASGVQALSYMREG